MHLRFLRVLMAWQFIYFLCWIVLYCLDGPFYPFTCWRASCLLPGFVSYDNPAVKIHMQVLCGRRFSAALGNRKEENFWIVLERCGQFGKKQSNHLLQGLPHSAFCQQWVGVPGAPYPRQHLVWSAPWTGAVPIAAWGCLVSAFVSLVARLLTGSFATCVTSLMTCLSGSLAHLLIDLCVFLLGFKSS